MEADQKNRLMQELGLLLMYLFSWEEKDITGSAIFHIKRNHYISLVKVCRKAKILLEKFASA